MAQLNEYFRHAELALSAYAYLQPGELNLDSLKNQGMSASQAQRFADRWRVIEQFDHYVEETYVDEFGQEHYFNNPSGLSVTLFEEAGTGKQCVAIRGTNDPADILTDIIDIAVLGTWERQTQYLALKDKVQAWIDDGVLQPGFTVTGHSLGGFLAGALLVDFSIQIEHAYLYNAPGVGGVLPAALQNLLSLPAEPTLETLDRSKVSSLVATAGSLIISGMGTGWNEPVPIFIEDQKLVPDPPLARNHGQQALTDALAVYDLLLSLDSSLSLESITEILTVASNKNAWTLESVVNALGELFNKGEEITSEESRDSLYSRIFAIRESMLFDRVAGLVSVTSLGDLSAADLAAAAQEDIATRYALTVLNPFVLEGDDTLYAVHNAQGELDLYDEGSGIGAMTSQYIHDRVEVLQRFIDFATVDSDLKTIQPDNVIYEDREKGITLTEVSIQGSSGESRRIIFGSDADDAGQDKIEGGAREDRLYGEGGSDVLRGRGGNDYLEGNDGVDHLYGDAGDDHLVGGAWGDTLSGGKGLRDLLEGGKGDDTYVYHYGDQGMTVRDVDGQGEIAFVDENCVFRYVGGSSVHRVDGTDNVYMDGRGFRYIYENDHPLLGPGELFIVTPDGGTIRIENFVENALGISLQEPAPQLPVSGSVLFFADEPGSTFNVSDGTNKVAEAHGKPGDDWIRLNHVFDYDRNVDYSGIRIYGEGGDDDIDLGRLDHIYHREYGWPLAPEGTLGGMAFGGDGDDTLSGSLYDDVLHGENGHDWLGGSGGGDVVIGGLGNDVVQGDSLGAWLGIDRYGKDVLVGGEGIDYLFGGGADDQLIGGTEGDFLFGDTVSGYAIWDGESASFHAKDFGDGNLPEMYFAYDVELAAAGNDFLDGGAGDDSVFGGAGEDTLLGGSGNDTLQGEAGDDVLYGGDDDDLLWGDKAPDAYANDMHRLLYESGPGRYFFRKHEDGVDVAGNDYLYGGAGADGLEGGAGDDVLDGGRHSDVLLGGLGNDTYLIGFGDDQDYIYDEGGAKDRIIFQGGITTDNLAYLDNGVDLHIYLVNNGVVTTDVVTLAGQGGVAPRSTGVGTREAILATGGIESLQFSDASVIDVGEIDTAVMRVYDGDTVVLAGDGSDGTFHFSANQFVSDFNIVVSDTGGTDSFEISRFVQPTPNQLTLSGLFIDAEVDRVVRDGDDLLVDMTVRSNIGGYFNQGAAGALRVEDYFSDRGCVESIRIGGTELVPEELLRSVPETGGSRTYVRPFTPLLPAGVYEAYDQYRNYGYAPEAVTVVGTDAAEVLAIDVPAQAHGSRAIYGHGGDDLLTGTAERDVLVGGAGDDRLEGGAGYDIYHIDPSDADEVFDDERGAGGVSIDSVVVPAGVLLEDLELAREGDDLLIGNTRIERFFREDDADGGSGSHPYRVEKLLGEGWTIQLPDHVSELFAQIWGTEQSEVLSGDARANVFVVDIGNNGVDEVIDDAVSIQDVLRLNASITEVDFSWAPTDYLGRPGIKITSLSHPEAVVTVRLAGPHDDPAVGIETYEFLDTTLTRSQVLALLPPPAMPLLDGDQAANDLIGGVAGEVLVGKGGDDLLSGRAGGDVYLYNAGDSAGFGDFIDDFEIDGDSPGDDTLSLGGGIRPGDVTAALLYEDYGGEYELILQLEFGDGGAGVEIFWELGFVDGGDLWVETYHIEQLQFLGQDGWSVFDMQALVDAQYDALLAAGAGGTSIQLITPELSTAAVISANAEIFGGDFAYNYSTTGDPYVAPVARMLSAPADDGYRGALNRRWIGDADSVGSASVRNADAAGPIGEQFLSEELNRLISTMASFSAPAGEVLMVAGEPQEEPLPLLAAVA